MKTANLMTTTIARPTNLNSAAVDHVTENGSRISSPVYIDVTTVERKALLNAIRQTCSQTTTTQVHSVSGISVESSSPRQNEIEQRLGCSLDVLRSVLFQRGGLPIDLVLKLQILSGYEVVSLKDIEQGLKVKINAIKEFVKEFQ
jgi:hypothetical protein